MKNKWCQTRPTGVTKGVSCQPNKTEQICQTDAAEEDLRVESVSPRLEEEHECEKGSGEVEKESTVKTRYIPIPIPVYVPFPLPILRVPTPSPIPFPIPIPIPIFIPTTSPNTLMDNHIQRIAEKIPSDPFEAEMVIMAEKVAHEPNKSTTPSMSNRSSSLLNRKEGNSSECQEDGLDVLIDLPGLRLSPTSVDSSSEQTPLNSNRRKRRLSNTFNGIVSELDKSKKPKSNHYGNHEEPSGKLKTVLGLKAWRGWVTEKNLKLEKEGKLPLKSDILEMNREELSHSLSLFVKEVRKPDGELYNPDSIFYLCLALQEFRAHNGALDNIFTDHLFEDFTETFDNVAHSFLGSHPDAYTLVARVEEEHLWEAGQLGPQSPYILLTTLLFFNTKYFRLRTPEEHMELTFGHIVKQWKKNPGDVSRPKRSILRYFPPQSSRADNSAHQKPPLEQEEDVDNRYRCPVKLYEFYLSKCPESLKGKMDSPYPFYLEPEVCCIPDSPVWYSSTPLRSYHLAKMLNRLKMVREINLSLTSSSSSS